MMTDDLEPQTEQRRFVIEWRSGPTSTIMAATRAKALYAACLLYKEMYRSADMKDILSEQIVRCSIHPDDKRPRGPKPGTPNAYFQRYPGELSLKEQRRRRIKPEGARLDPRRNPK